MDAIIQQILLFLFFINFPKTILSKNSCPSSSCGSGTIKYPFKLQTDPLPKHCQDYITLRCNNQGQAVINLPSSGDFYVNDIYYFAQKIYLSDPENCLPRRLMTNFSLSPLEAFRYENYTYYSCPRESVVFSFSEIRCLSNSTNVTIATTSTFSSEFMEETHGCRAIVSSMIPVSWTTQYDFRGVSVDQDLELTWNISGCKDCEQGYDAENSGDSRSKWKKLVGSPLFILSATVIVTFTGAACFLRVIKLILARENTNNTTDNSPPPGSVTTGTTTTVAAPGTTGYMPSAPPVTTSGTVGIDASKLKNCTELVVLGENQGTSLPISVNCSICLEEYQGENTVRHLPHCGHYFHVECIDQWLQKNNTCPVCRSTLFE